MAYTSTGTQIVAMARQLADEENSTFVTDANALIMCNAGIADLWEQITEADPHAYYAQDDFATTAGTTSYTLPSDFYEVFRVDLVQNGVNCPIPRFQLQTVDIGTAYESNDWAAVSYRIMGRGIDGSLARIHILPDPGDNTYLLHYGQCPQRLASLASNLDNVAGWDRYVALCVAIDMVNKGERDPSALSIERERVLSRIVKRAGKRDQGRPDVIADVRSLDYFPRRWSLP